MSWLVALMAIIMGTVVLIRKMELQAQQRGKVQQEVWQRLELLEATQKEMLKRIEHLEAIVVSEMWDAFHTEDIPRKSLSPPMEQQTPAAQVAEMARRLEGGSGS